MTIDPIRDGDNWDAYVGNDPVMFVDPLGLEPSYAGMDSSYYYSGKSEIHDYTVALEEAIQKYTDSTPSTGVPIKAPYRITDYPGHKATYGKVATDIAVEEGTPIYTTTEETVDVVKWDSNDETYSEFTFESSGGDPIVTQGKGYGYYMRTSSTDGPRVYAHNSPSAQSTRTWSKLLRVRNHLVSEYGSNIVPPVTLPANVQIGAVGMTGNTTGPHTHYEGPEKVPPYTRRKEND